MGGRGSDNILDLDVVRIGYFLDVDVVRVR